MVAAGTDSEDGPCTSSIFEGKELSMQELPPTVFGLDADAGRAGHCESSGRTRTASAVMDRGSTLDVALRHQRPVICAVDSDDLAPGVLATAAVLSAQLAVPLTVIHSADPDLFLTGEPRRAALQRGHAFVDALTEGYTLDERVVEVDDPARLVMAIAEAGASLIVIGTRGRTGLRAAVMGSVSQTVIGSATCPVLVIPSTAARTFDDVSGALERPLSPP